MSEKKQLTPEERAQRGKRLLIYGMFSLVVVTFVSVFLSLWLITGGGAGPFHGLPLTQALIVSGIALVACVIVWFIYTRLILKD